MTKQLNWKCAIKVPKRIMIMLIHCKKTGEEYEITDREIGERVECPCCGEKFVVDDTILPADVYTAALIRKTEAIVLRDEPKRTLYEHGTESGCAVLFDGAYEYNNAEAQLRLARWLYDGEREYVLAAYWFECAAKQGDDDAAKWLNECHKQGLGCRQENGSVIEQDHISDLLEVWKHEHSEEVLRILNTWRESIDINCPHCEAAINLPTSLEGSTVKCPSCKGAFMARGEGIMTSDERRRYRIENRFNDKAYAMAERLGLCESVVSYLKQKLGARELHILGHGEGVGRGNKSPWLGVYIGIQWLGNDVELLKRQMEFRGILESALGVWLRLVSFSGKKASIKNMTFYVRQDHPCRQNEAVKNEIENKMRDVANHKDAIHPLVAKRQPELERLRYLLQGDIEFLECENNLCFYQYLNDRYHIGEKYRADGLFIRVLNFPPDDSRGVRFGLDDGFGVIVSSPVTLKDEVFDGIVRDIEKRISRPIIFVMRTYSDEKYEYSFALSTSNSAKEKSDSSSLIERRIKAIRASLKSISNSEEVKVFRDDLSEIKNEIEKGSRIAQDRAIEKVKSRIPFILRPFTSLIINHRNETGDELRFRELSLKIDGVKNELAIRERQLLQMEKERQRREAEERERKSEEARRQKADAERRTMIDGFVDEITRFVKSIYEKERPASIRDAQFLCQDGEVVFFVAENVSCVPKKSETHENGTFVITNKRIVYTSERHMQTYRMKNIKDFSPCWTLDAGWIGIATSDKRSERYYLNSAWRPTLLILFVANDIFREKLLSQDVNVSVGQIWDKILSFSSPLHAKLFDELDTVDRNLLSSVLSMPDRPSEHADYQTWKSYDLIFVDLLDHLLSSCKVPQECKGELSDIRKWFIAENGEPFLTLLTRRRLYARYDAVYKKFGLKGILEDRVREVNLERRSRFRL